MHVHEILDSKSSRFRCATMPWHLCSYPSYLFQWIIIVSNPWIPPVKLPLRSRRLTPVAITLGRGTLVMVLLLLLRWWWSICRNSRPRGVTITILLIWLRVTILWITHRGRVLVVLIPRWRWWRLPQIVVPRITCPHQVKLIYENLKTLKNKNNPNSADQKRKKISKTITPPK